MTMFIHDLNDDLRGTRITRRRSTHNPNDVPRGLHKEYARMERMELPMENIDSKLTDALSRRRSCNDCSQHVPLSLTDCGTLLGHALRARPNSFSRNYPSGGALFPVETYLICPSFADARGGVFHYHPTAHALERLWDVPPHFDMKDFVNGPSHLKPQALVVFTSVWRRSSAKYGDFTYTVALLEAGHMSENIVLMATALGLDTRPMAGFCDFPISQLLDLDTNTEQPIHSVTLCKSAH